jgi:EmrB/QacA subfamily drug resistance transporter
MKKRSYMLIAFLLGILIGALDTGIVSPARTVIADSLKLTSSTSIWVITIYTLAYAVSMPISGKIADRYGKKKIFTFSILIFGIGSLLCGLSNYSDSFSFLLTARVIQAIGGGGIMPIATAFIGESFPPEKRGSALGMVGAIFGIATTIGPTVGSAVLDTFGVNHWGILFFINLPICILVIILSLISKDEDTISPSKKMDILGSFAASLLILSLMYGLTNLDFHNFKNSIVQPNVYPYLIAFIILIPIFIIIEKKAEDPIINLKYFKNRNIAITLILSFIVGCGMMGVVFVPQFGENVLRIKTGNGGYLVTLMAIFSGVSAPLGGKLIDKYSAKLILILGFTSTAIGTLVLALITTSTSSTWSLILGLAFMGLGMGFTMGTPLNYLMQSYVDKSETSSAQSTLSLVRSIGVAISPNILVGFISAAGQNVGNNIMHILPKVNIPTGQGTTRAFDITSSFSGGSVSSKALSGFQNADVTTIFNLVKNFTSSMLDKVSPMIKAQLVAQTHNSKMNFDPIIASFKTNYLNSVDSVRVQIENTFQTTLNKGFSNLFLAAAILAFIGLIFTFLLKNKEA